MGRSYTYKYQVGRTYRIKHTLYDVVFSSTDKNSAKKKAKKYDYPIIKKDLGSYTVLIPVAPSMTAEMPDYRRQLSKYKSNWKKLRG